MSAGWNGDSCIEDLGLILYGSSWYLQYFYVCKVLNSRINTGQVVVVHLQHPQAGQRGQSGVGEDGQLVVAQVPWEYKHMD